MSVNSEKVRKGLNKNTSGNYIIALVITLNFCRWFLHIFAMFRNNVVILLLRLTWSGAGAAAGSSVQCRCDSVRITLVSLCSFIMASQVYSPTTAPNPKDSWFMVPSDNLDKIRFGIKVVEVVSSNVLKCFRPLRQHNIALLFVQSQVTSESLSSSWRHADCSNGGRRCCDVTSRFLHQSQSITNMLKIKHLNKCIIHL